MANGPHLDRLFATPVMVDHMQSPASLNHTLEKLILARQSVDAGVAHSNLGGWHSALDLLRWATDPIRPVVQRIIQLADSATDDLQAKPGERRGWMLEAWANVNPPGGAANAMHSHGGSYWSAVYYVRVDPGEGGELVLYDPRLPMIDMHAPALRFRECGGEQQAVIKPVAGMIVIFPSWLQHAVRPWIGDGSRISIAMNLSAQARPTPISS